MSFSRAKRITTLDEQAKKIEKQNAAFYAARQRREGINEQTGQMRNLPLPVASSVPRNSGRSGTALRTVTNQMATIQEENTGLKNENTELKKQLKKFEEASPGIQLECPICMESHRRIIAKKRRSNGQSQQMLVTPCGHMFCQGCLKKAWDQSRKCPSCRASISLFKSCHPVFL